MRKNGIWVVAWVAVGAAACEAQTVGLDGDGGAPGRHREAGAEAGEPAIGVSGGGATEAGTSGAGASDAGAAAGGRDAVTEAGASGLQGGAGGFGGVADAPAGAAGTGGAEAEAPGVLEYEDDFAQLGDWVLDVSQGNGSANGAIEKGELRLYSDQGWTGRCPVARATLALPNVAPAPAGATTLLKLLLHVTGGASGYGELVFSRSGRQYTVTLPLEGDDDLVIEMVDDQARSTFAGVSLDASNIKVDDAPSAETSLSIEAIACGVDLGAQEEIGIAQLEIRTVAAP